MSVRGPQRLIKPNVKEELKATTYLADDGRNLICHSLDMKKLNRFTQHHILWVTIQIPFDLQVQNSNSLLCGNPYFRISITCKIGLFLILPEKYKKPQTTQLQSPNQITCGTRSALRLVSNSSQTDTSVCPEQSI